MVSSALLWSWPLGWERIENPEGVEVGTKAARARGRVGGRPQDERGPPKAMAVA